MDAILACSFFGADARGFLGLEWSSLTILGFMGNVTFSTRFLLQWIASEKRGESVIPVAFWYWSILGSLLMAVYFVGRRDPVGILAYLPNTAIYVRNLYLIRRKSRAAPAPRPAGGAGLSH